MKFLCFYVYFPITSYLQAWFLSLPGIFFYRGFWKSPVKIPDINFTSFTRDFYRGFSVLPGIFLTTFENLDFRELIQESYVKTLLRLNQTILETFEKLNLLNKTSYFRLITQKYDIFGFTGDFEQKSLVNTKTMKWTNAFSDFRVFIFFHRQDGG